MEINVCSLICDKRSVGLFIVDATNLKRDIFPSPQRCLKVFK